MKAKHILYPTLVYSTLLLTIFSCGFNGQLGMMTGGTEEIQSSKASKPKEVTLSKEELEKAGDEQLEVANKLIKQLKDSSVLLRNHGFTEGIGLNHARRAYLDAESLYTNALEMITNESRKKEVQEKLDQAKHGREGVDKRKKEVFVSQSKESSCNVQ